MVVGNWIGCYNTRHPHLALGNLPPAEAFALETRVEQEFLSHCKIFSPINMGSQG